MLDRNRLEEALRTLGRLLEERGLTFEVVAVGGSGLLLLGASIRATKDLDCVARLEGGRWISADPLPEPLRMAVADAGELLGIESGWLNAGPAGLFSLGLPQGFEQRLVRRAFGGLVVHAAGRFDQICFKLYAAVDQGPRSKHFSDLRELQPRDDELRGAARWTRTHDPSPGFRTMLLEALVALGVEDPDAAI
jgi:hypothetical protein